MADTNKGRERLLPLTSLLLIVFVGPILWPVSVVRGCKGRRELARLKALGVSVTAVDASEGAWRLQLGDGSERRLTPDEIVAGTWYDFQEAEPVIDQTVLQLELASSATLILIGPTYDWATVDPLAELRKALVAAGRVRGPVWRIVDPFPSALDLLMALVWGVWLLLVFVLGAR